MKLSDQTVLVTGGASGIGFALAKRFAARGNTVIVCGRDQAKLDAAKSAVPSLHTMRADVTSAAEREKLAAAVTRNFPALSVLVNNAGIQMQQAPWIGNQEWAAFETEITTNFTAPVHLTTLLIGQLASRQDAVIVNVTSGLAFAPMARMPTYCATKAAMHSFTVSLRHQLRGTSVTVVELVPPAVNTDLGGKGLHDFGEPVDAYADDAMAGLAAGKQEIGFRQSEAMRTADRAAAEAMFARMNQPA